MEEGQPAEPHSKRSSPEEPHRPRQAAPLQPKPEFNWKAPDRYVQLLNFKIEVVNILKVKVYDINDEETVPIIKNRLGRESLQFIQTLTNTKRDA